MQFKKAANLRDLSVACWIAWYRVLQTQMCRLTTKLIMFLYSLKYVLMDIQDKK